MKGLLIDKQKGIGVLEVIISLMVITSAVTAVILVIFSNQDIKLDDEVNNVALYRASEMIEKARAAGATDFNSVVTGTSSYDIFNQSLTVSDISPCRKNVTSSVGWSVKASRSQNVFLTTSLVSREEALALGSDCDLSGGPISEWWYPDTFVDIDLNEFPGGAGNSGVGATSIDVIKKDGSRYAVLSTNHSAEKDVWLINVDDSSTPVLTSSLETTDVGNNNLDGTNSTIFAITAGTTADPSTLQIVDITDINNPSLVSTRSLDISGACSGNPNYCPNSQAIFYYDGRVYVGVHRTNGDEFQIFDASSPHNRLGSLEINHNVNSIIVQGQYAYLATSDNTGELMVIDISDPGNLDHPDDTGMKFDVAGNHDGTVLHILSHKLYLGRGDGEVSPYEPNLAILDISNPINLILLGSKVVMKNGPQALGLIAITVSGKFSFLGTDDDNMDFQVFRIENPANIQNCSEPGYPGGFSGCGKYDFPAKITDLEYDDNLIYASIESNATFRIIFDDVIQY